MTFPALSTALVLAQSGVGPDWAGEMLKWGPPGVVLVLVLVGVLVPKYVLDRADREFDRIRKQRDDLVEQMREVVPVLGQVQAMMLPTLDRVTESSQRMQGEMVELKAELRRLGDQQAARRDRSVG